LNIRDFLMKNPPRTNYNKLSMRDMTTHKNDYYGNWLEVLVYENDDDPSEFRVRSYKYYK